MAPLLSRASDGGEQIDYFISNRLRNIPLVSAGKNWSKNNASKHSGASANQINRDRLEDPSVLSAAKQSQAPTPLASSGRSTANSSATDSAIQSVTMNSQTTTTTTTTAIPATSISSIEPQISGNQSSARTVNTNSKLNQVGKRDASSSSLVQSHGKRIQNQSEVLFKQGGSTASIAKVARSTTTTTRRPKTTTSTTRRPAATSRKPAPHLRPTVRQKVMKTVTSTTTKRPRMTSNSGKSNSKLAKMIMSKRQEALMNTTSGNSITTTIATAAPTVKEVIATTNEPEVNGVTNRFIEPISSYKMSTLEAISSSSSSSSGSSSSGSSGSRNGKSDDYTAESGASDYSTATQQLMTTASLPPVAIIQQQQQTSLTKAMQTLTTQPVNQRRNQQNIVNSRGYSNRLNDRGNNAGENWYLFNRMDGHMSAFEILVLISNVLIVCTVIIVILFNWIKVFKRKRRLNNNNNNKNNSEQQQQQPHEVGPSPGSGIVQQASGGQAITLDAINSGDRASSKTAALRASASESIKTADSDAAKQPQQQQQRPQQLHQRFDDAAIVSDTISTRGQNVVSTLQANTNRAETMFNSVSSNGGVGIVANKATAIVQPSENSSKMRSSDSSVADNKLKLFGDELAKQGRAIIGRSVSDLSGGGGGGGGGSKELASKQQQHETPKEVKRSADDSMVQKGSTTPERVAALEDLFKEQQQQGSNRKMLDAGDSSGLSERPPDSSLDSIELPETLVNSIKSGARNLVDVTAAPSPNLLLGEAAASPGGNKQPQAAATREDPKVNRPNASDTDKKQQQKSAGQSEEAHTSNAEVADKATAREATDSKLAEKDDRQTDNQQLSSNAAGQRPENPMSRELVGDGQNEAGSNKSKQSKVKGSSGAVPSSSAVARQVKEPSAGATTTAATRKKVSEKQKDPTSKSTAEVKNHQVVVNKLDKRKTDLEIVDLRDESVTGKMRLQQPRAGGSNTDQGKEGTSPSGLDSSWISMDGVAVVHPPPPPPAAAAAATTTGPAIDLAANPQSPTGLASINQEQAAAKVPLTPSEIIESRFHVDYRSKRKAVGGGDSGGGQRDRNSESLDSKQEEYVMSNIENELEQDNKMRNRKYFVYVVHDGNFTARKECIARIELPQRRRITLAELRQLIANSQDISLTGLRRNRFKFVTETYRLLNENEDAAVLHQVYPTQGVFLKLNVAEQDNSSYPFKGGRARLSSSSATTPSISGAGGGGSLSQNATIASRRRANARSTGRKLNSTSGQDGTLPAIEVDFAQAGGGSGRARASSVGRRRPLVAGSGGRGGAGAYKRSQSSVQVGRGQRSTATGGRGGGAMRRGASGNNMSNDGDLLPAIGMSTHQRLGSKNVHATSNYQTKPIASQHSQHKLLAPAVADSNMLTSTKQSIESAASDLGANMLSGAKKLFTSTLFHR